MTQLENSNGNVDNVISATVELEGELSEAEGYLRAMEIEFRTISSADKKNAQQKTNDYKDEYRQLQENFKKVKNNADLIVMKNNVPNSQTKLVTFNQKLDSSTALLEKSRQTLAQTDALGDNIISNLEAQRENLVDADEKVRDTKKIAVDAKYVLRMMGNRALMHKACVMLTIVILGKCSHCNIVYVGLIMMVHIDYDDDDDIINKI